MIQATDNPGRSIQAVYLMWKAKVNPATFPAIPEDMGLAVIFEFVNKWLFDTQYLDQTYYRSTYENCKEEIGEDKIRAMLGEIFCN